MSPVIIAARILISALFGGLVGFEREIHGRAAGLRTHILVCVGSTLFMLTSILIAQHYGRIGGVDPSRIASGVVTGIGFLGAGAIIRFGASVKGLTTAASIWAVSAIGLAAGAGFFLAAAITTGLVILVLFLSRIEERMELKGCQRKLKLEISSANRDAIDEAKRIIDDYGVKISRITTDKEDDKVKVDIDLLLSRRKSEDFISEISALPGVIGAELE